MSKDLPFCASYHDYIGAANGLIARGKHGYLSLGFMHGRPSHARPPIESDEHVLKQSPVCIIILVFASPR